MNDFSRTRFIESAAQIPRVRCSLSPQVVGLVGTDEDLWDAGIFDRAGVRYIERRDPFPFARMEKFLPRMARREIHAEVVDLIPYGSWFASLANILVGSSWKALRDWSIQRSRACEECGDPNFLEGHEIWSYDTQNHIQSLKGIRCLCARCHATQHLGRANVVGNFDGVFDRLCAVNRIKDNERCAYRNAIFDKYERRSTVQWSLDVSWALKILPSLALKTDVLFDGDGWIWREAKGERPQTEMQLVNVEIGSDGRRLFLIPAGTPLAAAV